MRAAVLVWTDQGWSEPLSGALDSPGTIVLAFGSAARETIAERIAELRGAFPRSLISGCSTAGEILGEDILDGSLVVTVMRFETATLRMTYADVPLAAKSRCAGESIATDLAGPDLRAVFVLSDGLTVNGSELIRGLNALLPADVMVTGGLAADGDRFASTWVISQGEAISSRVMAVGFYGPSLRVGHGSRGGWDIFGPERVATRSEGNVLFELDGRPALDLYKEYLGELSAGLPATALLFPLAILGAGGQADIVVRTVLAVDEAQNSLTFAGDVPQGSTTQLMRANFDRLVDASATAVAEASQGAIDPEVCIAISCVGRRLVLGERSWEELSAARESLPARTLQVGFYSYGEISPLATGACDLHNQTMTVTTFAEVG